YRRIGGAISGHALLHAGEEIPIQVDNAPRLVAAVDSLLRSALSAPHAAKPPASPGDAADFDHALERVERGLRASLSELDKLSAMRPDTARRIRLRTAVSEAACKLKMIDMQVGV